MNKVSWIICYHWQEPTVGCAAFVASLSPNEKKRVEETIDFINSHNESGFAVAEFIMLDQDDVQGGMDDVQGGMNYHNTMSELKLQSRYSEEMVFTTKNPNLEAAK